jgi:serine protease DegS
MPAKRYILSYFWPVICGLLVAAILALVAPGLVGLRSSELETQDSAPSNIGDNRLGPVSYSDAVARAAPSVVSIYARVPAPKAQNQVFDDSFFRQFFNTESNQAQYDINSGAGVIIGGEGHILTNRHLIEGSDQIGVVTADGRQAAARVVGIDAETDLAVLITDLEDTTAISIGDSESVAVGDIVLAIGNPFGRGQTVTQGIVSATGRELLDLSAFVNFLQTDAAINEGNSGGALIDVYGNLIGINTAVISVTGAEGISFAIPARMAVDVVRQIVENGAVLRGWVGISAGEITTQLAQIPELETSRAMMVTGLEVGGPARSAGMEEGDIIVNINNETLINGRQVLELISSTKPGELLTFGVYRNDRKLTIQVRAAIRPSN